MTPLEVAILVHPVDGEHLAPDEILKLADKKDLGEDIGDLVLQLPDESGHGGEVRGAVSRERDEGDAGAAGFFDPAAADNAAGVGKNNQLEQHRRRVGRRPGFIVAIARVQAGQIQFVLEQVVERVLEGAGQQLAGAVDGKQPRRGIDRLVAGHRGIGSPAIAMPRSCGAPMTGAIFPGTVYTASLAL
jgi:hypothetical protein